MIHLGPESWLPDCAEFPSKRPQIFLKATFIHRSCWTVTFGIDAEINSSQFGSRLLPSFKFIQPENVKLLSPLPPFSNKRKCLRRSPGDIGRMLPNVKQPSSQDFIVADPFSQMFVLLFCNTLWALNSTSAEEYDKMKLGLRYEPYIKKKFNKY